MPVDANDAFTLILEPVKRCNLKCLYCYSDGSRAAVMSRQTLRTTLEKTARYAEWYGFREIHILWHGGEPLLAGLGFFKAALQILEGLSSDLKFQHYLQTNGLLLDHDFCAFFQDHAFQIGISLDGPQVLHDSMRIGAEGQGSHTGVLEKVRLLQEQGVSAGFNAVVTRRSLGQEKAIYQFFQGLGSGFRVNPVIPRLNPETSEPYLLQPGEYGSFVSLPLIRRMGQYGTPAPHGFAAGPVPGGNCGRCALRMPAAKNLCRVAFGSEACLGMRCCAAVLRPTSSGNIHDSEIQELLASPFCEDLRLRAEALSGCHTSRHWSI